MVRKINCKPCIKKVKAMTLIELLIVLVILGLLMAWAYPSYTAYVRSAHRQQAQLDMQRIQLALERHYQHGYSLDKIMAGNHCLVCQSDMTYYQFEVTLTEAGYDINAFPQENSQQHLDTCNGETYTMLTLQHTGQTEPSSCW